MKTTSQCTHTHMHTGHVPEIGVELQWGVPYNDNPLLVLSATCQGSGHLLQFWQQLYIHTVMLFGLNAWFSQKITQCLLL